MKQLILAIICACTALAAAAGVPKSDVARVRQALKSKSTAITASMREGKVTPGVDRITDKAPRRLTSADIEGTRLVIVSAQALEDEYDLLLNDTVYCLGWSSDIFADEDSVYGITNFLSDYPLPLYIDEENGTAFIAQCLLQTESIQGTYSQRFRTDTLRSIYFLTPDYLFFDYYEDLEGSVYDDGSILFDGKFLIYTEEILETYSRTNTLVSKDTLAYISPIYSDLTLLKPNGIHDFSYGMTTDGISPTLDINQFRVNSMVSVYDNLGHVSRVVVGFPGGNTSTTTGLRPKPIDPRKPTSKLPHPSSSATDDNEVSDSVGNDMLGLSNLNDLLLHAKTLHQFEREDGTLGFTPRPPVDPRNPSKPKSFNPYLVRPSDNNNNNNNTIFTAHNPRLTDYNGIQAPVYMFQADDSTLCILNIFNQGYTMSFLYFDGDGNMTYPAQPLYYDEYNGEDFYNCTKVDNNLVGGNTGTASADTISWGTTYPHGLTYGTILTFNDNKLYFTDGSIFLLPPMLGDVNRDKALTIGDVTALISHLLSGDFDVSISFSPSAADTNKDGNITIGDVTRLISMVLAQGHVVE